MVSCSSIPTQSQNKSNIKLNLNIETSNKNKEIIIESLLKEGIRFSINFDANNSYLLKNEVLNSNMKYFCKSFINEQRDIIESAVFDKEVDDKRILIIYSDKYINSVTSLKSKYPKEIYYLLSKKNFENNIKKILDVNLSDERYAQISNLDKNLKIQHSPRVRKDISKIYFLIDYDLGKTIVPIFKNYALGMNFFSTSELFHGATDIKKLADFEGTSIPLSSEIFINIKDKKNIINIQNEFEILMINDFLEIEKMYQNNLYKKNIQLETGYTRIQKNKCISRRLPIWKINMNSLIPQS
tara:strand:+ start:338 stop:1231 length:894 start_codon:yes stop_codon:yes gene_type:complete